MCEQFGRQMYQDFKRNIKLFWEKVSKVETCNRIKDRTGRLALE